MKAGIGPTYKLLCLWKQNKIMLCIHANILQTFYYWTELLKSSMIQYKFEACWN